MKKKGSENNFEKRKSGNIFQKRISRIQKIIMKIQIQKGIQGKGFRKYFLFTFPFI